LIAECGEKIATVFKDELTNSIKEQEESPELIAALQKFNDINTLITTLVQKSELE
jgi:hypothetical protein